MPNLQEIAMRTVIVRSCLTFLIIGKEKMRDKETDRERDRERDRQTKIKYIIVLGTFVS